MNLEGLLKTAFEKNVTELSLKLSPPVAKVAEPLYFSNLHVLKVIDSSLSDVDLFNIISSFDEKSPITSLFLQKNNITSLVSPMSSFKIRTLNVGFNCISSIQAAMLSKESIQALILNNNNISMFPNIVLPYLNSLVLSHNKLVSISLNLPSLTKLSLSYNQITTFPSLAFLPSLCELRLSNNRIKDLPSRLEISRYKCVDRLLLLDLGRNLLSSSCFVPLSAFSRLGNLTLKGNPLAGDGEKDGDSGDEEAAAYITTITKLFPLLRVLDNKEKSSIAVEQKRKRKRPTDESLEEKAEKEKVKKERKGHEKVVKKDFFKTKKNISFGKKRFKDDDDKQYDDGDGDAIGGNGRGRSVEEKRKKE